MWSEFKEFLFKANVLALALAFILGVALAAVVNSLVKDIIMPPVGLALGGVDFNNLFIDLSGKHPASLKAALQHATHGLDVVSSEKRREQNDVLGQVH